MFRSCSCCGWRPVEEWDAKSRWVIRRAAASPPNADRVLAGADRGRRCRSRRSARATLSSWPHRNVVPLTAGAGGRSRVNQWVSLTGEVEPVRKANLCVAVFTPVPSSRNSQITAKSSSSSVVGNGRYDQIKMIETREAGIRCQRDRAAALPDCLASLYAAGHGCDCRAGPATSPAPPSRFDGRLLPVVC